jgi:RNA 3'-phosphate cyclase
VEYVLVDGSRGEGGGQILRTAIAFSVIQGRPVRVERIRAGRKVPGLKRQHVSALQVIAKVFDGALTGVTEGSREVTFVPGGQRLQTLSIDMGTAASITLVLQAVVPAVALTHSRLRIDLVGGTDVPWSPTYDYLDRIVRECYRSIGIVFSVAAERRGYYPRGGGRVTASIEPCGSVSSLQLTSPHTIPGVSIVSRCGRLPMHVAERQLSSASTSLEKSGIRVLETCLTEEQADSPGSSILAFHVGLGMFLGSDCIGARGKPAEEVGREAAMKFMTAMRSGACLDSNLADMVLPLLSLAPRPSKVAVPAITPHLESGLQLANQFTGCSWSAEAQDGKVIVAIEPRQSD